MDFSFPPPVVPPTREYSSARLDELHAQATKLWLGISRRSCANALGSEFAAGDVQRAAVLLQFYAAAECGHITPIRKRNGRFLPLRGAMNLGGVTCYIDSLLIAMFSRMEIFEPLLYERSFRSKQVDLLATWLRLFVNLLRNGERITGDIVGGLLSAAIGAGWQCDNPGNTELVQQDAAEFFVFITSVLRMPLLALKVDIAHAGKEQREFDHKLVKEQLLYLSVPGSEEDPPILLEECLEIYFSNQVSVRRHLEPPDNGEPDFEPSPRRRSYSIVSLTSPSPNQQEIEQFYANSSHAVYSANQANQSNQPPGLSTPQFQQLQQFQFQQSPQTSHQDSAVSEPPSYTQLFGSNNDHQELARARDMKRSLWTSNNEIMLPAWMFLQLMPFYSADIDLNRGESVKNIMAEEVSRLFGRQRPVLGLCLKRYFFDAQGRPQRNNRVVVVPEVISMPSFVADDSDQHQAFGKFRLVLESAVFHRGSSIHSGHYCALVGQSAHVKPTFNVSNRSSVISTFDGDDFVDTFENFAQNTQTDDSKRWFFFDDLQENGERFKEVDFHQVFEKETPYLLFYRLVSLEDEANEAEAAVAAANAALSAAIDANQSFRSANRSSTYVPSDTPSASESPTRSQSPSAEVLLRSDQKKKRKFFRRNKDKEVHAYAKKYREEKCTVM